ncbi:hypothetical protein GCM10027073_42320 [Streptomyces chlorus]|uniref:Uncharacterized protein n=1 Tax=Streptomyces chlorus TaxID=887452 RepID=A0ABW1E4X2_9ACTN
MAQALLGHHTESRRLRDANKQLCGTLPYPPRRAPLKPLFGMDEVGRSFSRGRWQQWPPHMRATVWEFLRAWWAHTLTDPDPAVPAHDVLALCAEASATLSPWLDTWETLDHRVADRHPAEAAAHWKYDLLGDRLPWEARDTADTLRTELATWLVRHAPHGCGPRTSPRNSWTG